MQAKNTSEFETSDPVFCSVVVQCAALVGEDQPLCPDLPELDLSELDVSDLDADSFLGGLKWYSDQSEIVSTQYGNEASNLFEVSSTCSQTFFCEVASVECASVISLLPRGSGIETSFEQTPRLITLLLTTQTNCTTVASLQTPLYIAAKYKRGDKVKADKAGRTFVPSFYSWP